MPNRTKTPTVAHQIKKLVKNAETKKWEDLFFHQVKALKLPTPFRQFKFLPHKEYKADFYFPSIGLVVEIDGGTWMVKGGHQTGVGYEWDRIRDAETVVNGSLVLRFTPGQIETGVAVGYVERLIRRHEIAR